MLHTSLMDSQWCLVSCTLFEQIPSMDFLHELKNKLYNRCFSTSYISSYNSPLMFVLVKS